MKIFKKGFDDNYKSSAVKAKELNKKANTTTNNEKINQQTKEKNESKTQENVLKSAKPIIINGSVFRPLKNEGPVPIVAPNKKGVQLSPIVVPVAFVPYATQKQKVIQKRTKKVENDDYISSNATYYNQINAINKKIAFKNSMRSFFMMILFIAFFIPTILGMCNVTVPHVVFFNLIESFKAFNNSLALEYVPLFIHCAALGFALYGFISSLIGVFSGKYKKYWIPALLVILTVSVNYAYYCIGNKIPTNQVVSCYGYQMIIHIGISFIIYLVSLIFIKRPTCQETIEEIYE